MLKFLRQIALDGAARLGLLGRSTFQADTVADFWGLSTVFDRQRGESFSRRVVTSWMSRRGASFPLRFVGFRFANGYIKRPTYIDLTIHGFDVGPSDEHLSFEKSLNLIWSSPLWGDGEKQKLYWSPLDRANLVPVL